MNIYESMRGWAKQYSPFGGSPSTPSSSGNDVLNQMQGLGMDTKQQQAWASRQPASVQMGGQTIGIPRQPWGFGAMPEAVAEAPVLPPAQPDQEIDWSALAALYSQMRQGQAQPRGVAPMPIAGRNRQQPTNVGQEQRALANAAVQPRLLIAGHTQPRRF